MEEFNNAISQQAHNESPTKAEASECQVELRTNAFSSTAYVYKNCEPPNK